MLAAAEEALSSERLIERAVNTSLQSRHQPTPESLRALLTDLIDYAGLFPPATLDMSTAVRNYGRYLSDEHAWMLARFVVPAGRLAEFELAQASVPVLNEWKLSGLLGTDIAAEIEAVAEFNLHNAGRARVDALEAKAANAEDIRRVDALLPAEMNAYFEIAPERAADLIYEIRRIGGRAKIRTGGVTAVAIPSPDTVAAFIADCARADIPFKATAGLHHALRGSRPLTYEADAPVATMHGFLNLLFAAAVAYHDPELIPEARACLHLSATSLDLDFTDDAVTVRIPHDPLQRSAELSGNERVRSAKARIPTASVRRTRRNFAISFGSCSFEEPISDLHELKLL